MALARWMLLVLCFAGFPFLILRLGIGNLQRLQRLNVQEDLRRRMNLRLDEIEIRLNPDRFWCGYLRRICRDLAEKGTAPGAVVNALRQEQTVFGEGFRFLVWNQDGQVFQASHRFPGEGEDWAEVGRMLLHFNRLKEGKGATLDLTRIRRALGSQFFTSHIGWPYEMQPLLIRADSSGQKPPFWLFAGPNWSVGVFLAEGLADDPIRVTQLAMADHNRKDRAEFRLAMASGSAGLFPGFASGTCPEEILAIVPRFERDYESFVETDRFWCLFRTGNVQGSLLAVADRARWEPSFLWSLGIQGLWLLFCLPFAGYAFRIVAQGQPNDLSIRIRLALLFLFANGLPLMALGFIGQDYLNQKRLSEMAQVQRRGIGLLRHFDQGMTFLHGHLELRLAAFLRRFARTARNRVLCDELNQEAIDLCGKLSMSNYFLVASSGDLMANVNGVFRGEDTLKPVIDPTFRASGKFRMRPGKLAEGMKSEYRLMNLMCRRILREVNGESGGTRSIALLEMMGESLIQKSAQEIIHSLFETFGSISAWSLGSNARLSYGNLFSVNGEGKADYLFLGHWGVEKSRLAYVETRLATFNRNDLGLRILVSPGGGFQMYPKGFPLTPELQQFVEKLGPKPNPDLETLFYRDGKYLVMGFTGKELPGFGLVGLYPLTRVEERLNGIRRGLWAFTGISLLVTLLLAGVLAGGFLTPIVHLTRAAQAIDQRRFDHRLPDLGNDEFGRMAGIFNEALIGLEELQVAGTVQESLFPSAALSCGDLRVYGRSISMGELGGDYFDYFPLVESPWAGVCIGDVAGHGVPAALIMAMAKAGVFQSRDCWDKPAALLGRLHSLILATKSRQQRKVMTFQYACLNGETGEVVLSNAGHAYPFCVRAGGMVEEIALAGPPLGAFRKATFQERSLSLEPGDALVLYTDGIVEAQNGAGQPLGYEGLQNSLKKCRDRDPEGFYQRVHQDYLAYTGSRDAQDDLTLIVIVRQAAS